MLIAIVAALVVAQVFPPPQRVPNPESVAATPSPSPSPSAPAGRRCAAAHAAAGLTAVPGGGSITVTSGAARYIGIVFYAANRCPIGSFISRAMVTSLTTSAPGEAAFYRSMTMMAVPAKSPR